MIRRIVVYAFAASIGCTQWDTARTDPSAAGPSSGGAIATALPCEIQSLLSTYCYACHGVSPVGGAPMALVTYANLMAPAKSDPSKRVADVCLSRMRDAQTPMPPQPPSPATADIQTFADWINGGAPMGECMPVNDPLNAAPTCTSGTSWQGGNEGSSRMHPGVACISCHSTSREAPRFALAGTVYPTGHEPDNCNAAGVSGAQVIITDAGGATTTLAVNSVGNFYLERNIALPYHAQVVSNGKTRAMSAQQTSGDCNSCHTQSGANSAPGRITLP